MREVDVFFTTTDMFMMDYATEHGSINLYGTWTHGLSDFFWAGPNPHK
jgi:hypothetical protein